MCLLSFDTTHMVILGELSCVVDSTKQVEGIVQRQTETGE